MKYARWLRGLSLVALISGGCDSAGTDPVVLPPPPADEGVYGYANGCYAVQGFDGVHQPTYLAVSGEDAFAFAAPTAGAASRFFLRASDLGTYLFYDRDERYLTAVDDGKGGGSV